MLTANAREDVQQTAASVLSELKRAATARVKRAAHYRTAGRRLSRDDQELRFNKRRLWRRTEVSPGNELGVSAAHLLSHRRTSRHWKLSSTPAERWLEGGIYDQLGGGFHRYATDARWLVPHFEKMLYDNALLSRLYLHYYQVS